jgi:hypothetical protein
MLLQVVQLPRNGVSGTPLFVEIPVYADSAPFLVTSNRGPLWIESPLKGGIVRSAILRGSWRTEAHTMYLRMCMEVIRRGKEMDWGNMFPGTAVGESEAREHLSSFGLVEADVLGPLENPWIPPESRVVVPRDRSYLGVLGVWDDNSYTVVLHNPSRGMAFLGDW